MKCRLIKREFERYLFDRKIFFVLVLLFVLNALAAFADEGSSEYSGNYRKLSTELEIIRDEERIAFLEDKMDRENKELLSDGENAEYHYSVLEVCRDMLSDIRETLDYDAYIQEVIDNAEMLETLYSHDVNYGKENLEKTKKDYEKLIGTDVSYTASRGFSKAVSSRLSMLLYLAFTVYIAAYFICRDKETNMCILIDSTANGGYRLLLARLLVCFVTGFFTAFLLFLENTLIYGIMYGGSSFSILNKPLQNLQGFTASAFKGSVLSYIVLNLLLLSLVHLLIIALYCFIYFLLKNKLLAYILIILLVGTEYFLYIKTDVFSVYFDYKCYNIFSLLFYNESVRRYVLVSCFGKIVEWRLVVIPVLIICATIMTGLCLVADRSRYKGLKAALPVIKVKTRQSGLMMKEARKLVFDSLLVPVLIVGIVFSLEYGKRQKDRVYTATEAYYRKYVREFGGEFDGEKLQKIEAEKRDAAEMIEKYSAMAFQNDRVRDYESREEALSLIENDCEYLKSKEGSWLVYSKGYERLFHNRTDEIILICTALIMTCLVSAFYWDMEYNSNAVSILTASYAGWKSIRRKKRIILACMSVLVCIAVYLPEALKIAEEYKIETLLFPVQSLESLSFIPQRVSFVFFLAGVMFLRTAVIYVYSLLMERIVKRFGSILAAVIVGLMSAVPVPLIIILFI